MGPLKHKSKQLMCCPRPDVGQLDYKTWIILSFSSCKGDAPGRLGALGWEAQPVPQSCSAFLILPGLQKRDLYGLDLRFPT